MTKMKLNNSVEFPISEYSRYTNIIDGNVISNATFRPIDTSYYSDFISLSQGTITDIKISENDNIIYHLENQEAKIVSIAENLYDEGIAIIVTLQFGEDVE